MPRSCCLRLSLRCADFIVFLGVEKIEGTEEEYELPVSFDENLDSSDAENDIDLREVPRGSEFDNDSDSGEVESGLELTDELDDFVAFNPSSWSDEE